MHIRSRLIRLSLPPVLVLLALTCVGGGFVDFSPNLIAYVGKRWGKEAPPRLSVWQRLVRDTQPTIQVGEEKTIEVGLRRINGFFNQVPYFTDLAHWGVDDYWATPVEMLSSYGGDCEDYSIGKFLSLRELRIPLDRLRITYVRALNLGESHMVLAYYPTPDADPLILDNLNREIKPASQRTDLEPVYSFNDEDLWLPNGVNRKGGSSQVRLWRDLLDKLAREQAM
jgi:predicted transglutaminase-like cysteine proteinase